MGTVFHFLKTSGYPEKNGTQKLKTVPRSFQKMKNGTQSAIHNYSQLRICKNIFDNLSYSYYHLNMRISFPKRSVLSLRLSAHRLASQHLVSQILSLYQDQLATVAV